jgi:Pyruvate/2-oxoglutarate dehydrogenase complex, dihydrolipoamide acyltransferase (E2) component, and related enzymes
MSYEFKLPDIGEGISEGEIVKWHVKEGDLVKEEQPLIEVMTDKVTVTIPSPVSGRVSEILAHEGEKVRVGQVLLRVATEGDQVTTVTSRMEETTPQAQPSQTQEEAQRSQPEVEQRRVLATPAVRKLARDLGVDISKVVGTGPSGRVTELDVRNYAEQVKKQAPPQGPAVLVEHAQPKPLSEAKPYPLAGTLEERVPLRGLRRTIAERMVKSMYTIPHVTHFDEVDATTLTKLREILKPAADKKGVKLTYLPFIVKALCVALKEFPYLNASLDDENHEIVLKKYYNIGIATAVPEGLVVPVVRDADKKSLFEVAKEISRLSEAARQNKLTLEDVRGGTFSVTNIGSIGGISATPIINYPEVGILGVYRITKKPVVVGDESIVVREILPITLTFDHRVIDGAVAASFVGRLKQILENMDELVAATL